MKRLQIEWIPSTIIAITLTTVSPIPESARNLTDKHRTQRCPAEKSALTKVIVLAREQGSIRTVTNSTVNCSLTAC